MKEDEKILDTGNIKISEDVITSIAAVAIEEVEGVKLPAASALDFAERRGKKGASRSIRLTFDEKELELEISVQMIYGVKIPQTALKVQQKVKESIESMTGLHVRKIDVTVVGVLFEEKKA